MTSEGRKDRSAYLGASPGSSRCPRTQTLGCDCSREGKDPSGCFWWETYVVPSDGLGTDDPPSAEQGSDLVSQSGSQMYRVERIYRWTKPISTGESLAVRGRDVQDRDRIAWAGRGLFASSPERSRLQALSRTTLGTVVHTLRVWLGIGGNRGRQANRPYLPRG